MLKTEHSIASYKMTIGNFSLCVWLVKRDSSDSYFFGKYFEAVKICSSDGIGIHIRFKPEVFRVRISGGVPNGLVMELAYIPDLESGFYRFKSCLAHQPTRLEYDMGLQLSSVSLIHQISFCLNGLIV